MRHRGISLLLLCACGSVSDGKKDAPAQCVPQSDTEFCAAIASACESHTAMDNCGMSRTVDCGACSGTLGCVAGTCKTPVCTTFNFTTTTIAAFSRSGVEDSIGSATPDGQVVVYIPTTAGAGCGAFHVVIADEVTPGSGTYTQRDVTTSFTALGLYTGQDGHTITADGLTVIARSTNSKQFLATKRSAINAVDFGAASVTDFDAINGLVSGNAGTFSGPVISADGLEFFFSINNVDTATNGIYSSVRTSPSMPFPPGTKLPAPAASYAIATGVSSDRLTLFVFDAFTGRALTRRSTTQPFTNPNAPAAPPQIAGWQHKPLADCSKLIAMISPGGCANEDIGLLTR